MIIEVIDVRRSPAGVRVDFECRCGAATAEWIGAPARPGERRAVEFGTDDTLTLGDNATAAAQGEPSLSMTANRAAITARAQALFNDTSTVWLAFADGRIEVQVAPVLAGWTVGEWYTIRLATLRVYAVNL